ncbi:MAG: tetratricopeptide repeat protein [Spirochaetota bacterium]
MIDPNKALSRAERLYRQGKYTDVIHLLEPQVFLFRDETRFYHLLGMACLQAQDLGGAETYLSRAVDLTPEAVDSRLALAALRARKGEVQRAMRDWLAVKEVDPKNRIAQSGLDLVRKSETESAVQRTLHGKTFGQYLPAPRLRAGRSLLLLAAVATVVLGSWLVVYVVDQGVFDGSRGEPRPGDELLILEDDSVDDLVAYSGSFRYTYTEDEIEQLVLELREYFHDERDNLARRHANRLLLSNASTEIKRRVSLLSDYFRVPDLVGLEDNFEYSDVAAEPWLYQGCYVKWRGRVANLEVSDDVIAFDFLVGFEEGRVLQGMVPTRFFFGVSVEPGTNVELLGEITNVEAGSFALRGEAVRLLGTEADR